MLGNTLFKRTGALQPAHKALLLLTCLALAMLGACAPSGPTKSDVFVYVAVPLSGFQANAGQTVLGGAHLAAEQINSAGGLLGHRVQVIGIDDESDSDVAADVAQEIREAVNSGQAVLGVIGHLNSGQTLRAMEIYKDLPLIVITPTASEVSLTQRGYDNFFRVNANDAVQARIAARFLISSLGARRIALVHNDTEYGVGLRDQMARELAALDAQVVLTLQVAEGQETYELEIAQIRDTNPEAIFYAGYEIEAPYLRLEMVDAGLTQPMLASDGAFLTATIDEAEGRAEGMYISAFSPSPQEAADEKWIAAYRQVEYRNPDTYSINGYSAMQTLAEGVKQARSMDSADIAGSLRSLAFASLIGEIAYEPSGDLKDPRIYIFQVQNGRFVQVFPE